MISQESASRQLPRDVFIYLLMIFALGASAISLSVLLFQFINIFIPDVASFRCMYDECRNAIRGSLAFLVVVFPVLLWTMRFIHRDVERFTFKRELPIRRWLLYLTLFIAGLIVMGDLVGLIRGYLQGELTVRFLLKIGAIFFVAGSMFYYYLQELHNTGMQKARLLGRIIIVIVIGVVIVGFVLSGSPMRQRDLSLDQMRVNDLQGIQNQIVNGFWRVNGRLPSSLSELNDDISGFKVSVDPKTNDPYGYARLGELTFKLCATFLLPSQEFKSVARPLEQGGNWEHKEGRTCFERTIDPNRVAPELPRLVQ